MENDGSQELPSNKMMAGKNQKKKGENPQKVCPRTGNPIPDELPEGTMELRPGSYVTYN